jgi:hypothetical protein
MANQLNEYLPPDLSDIVLDYCKVPVFAKMVDQKSIDWE